MSTTGTATRRAFATTGLLALTLASSCVGAIGDPGNPNNPNNPNNPIERPTCAATDVRPATAPLRQLTGAEYRNAVSALFPGVTLPTVTLSSSARVDGFNNNVAGQGVSPLLVEQFAAAASQIAQAVSTSRAWLACDPANAAACGHSTARALAARAYRRPLTQQEGNDLDALVDQALAGGTFNDAIGEVVEAVLQAPDFLYRPELGRDGDAPAGLRALSDSELATRLAFFLWRSIPDEALTTAAANGELRTAEGLATHARRMLMDARARAMVRDFHTQWFRLDRRPTVPLSMMRYPEYTGAVREALLEGTLRFIDRAFWDAGTLNALLTDSGAFVNRDTAAFYGVNAPAGNELTYVQTDPTQRAGILTQAGMLASTSHGITHSPVYRGLFVLEGLLCSPTGAPPPGVNAAFEGVPPGEQRTTRQHFELSHRQPQCASCHDRIDGSGFTFENFDALGRWRTMENGLSVDPSGQVLGTLDIDGTVRNAVELSQRLATSTQVRECVSAHWFRYAMGRTERREESCQIRALADGLQTDNGNLRELVVRIVQSPSFRYRPTP